MWPGMNRFVILRIFFLGEFASGSFYPREAKSIFNESAIFVNQLLAGMTLGGNRKKTIT